MNKRLSSALFINLVPVVVIVIVTMGAYCSILSHSFQIFWDDAMYITLNDAAKGLSLDHLIKAFATNYAGNFAPVHIISYMLDYTIWGADPKGFLLSNIILHTLNGILLYRLLSILDWSRPATLFSVMIFLLHPVQVESVAWISERKNLLAMFFSLLSFISYVIHIKTGSGGRQKFYVASFVFFTLALLSKSVAVVVPCIFILYDVCMIKRVSWRQLLLGKVPFLVAAAAMAIITIEFQAHGDVPGAGGGRTAYHGGSPLATGLTMLTVLPRYLKLLFWPTNLSAIYDPAIRVRLDAAVLLGGVLCGLLIVLGVLLYIRSRQYFFWYAVFFVGLLPVSQIVPLATLMNDRYLYFPMLGAAPLLGNLIMYKLPNKTAASIALAITTMLLLFTTSRTAIWQNDLTLWSDTVKKAPNHPVALYGEAQAHQNIGDLDAALPLYLKVLEIAPHHADTLLHLASLYRLKNLPAQGRPYLLQLTLYYPDFAQGFLDLGVNYYLTDELGESKKNLERTLVLQPNSVQALKHLGIISLRTRELDAATRYLKLALSLTPSDTDIAYNLACVEAQLNNSEEAVRYLNYAIASGFANQNIIKTDKDLDPIRSSPGFQRLVTSFKKVN
ncbi:tetratricopeptide repeat protein [Citrifermentans bremense]|uniref:tetratricopeptide repeat protein n=1 Tax=Citrifermentans bremense TaxID=60035 RepID=UPI0003FBC96D|nr:tetratricopeptide repeat protein [Citrifermentans bremense]